MKILKNGSGILVVEQYGNKYIDYDGGQIVEDLLKVKITEEDCDRILKDEITVEDVLRYYINLGLCDHDELRESLMKDYLRTQGDYSEKELNEIIENLRTDGRVFYDFYDYVFFEDHVIQRDPVEGFTAKSLVENYSLTPLEAYNYLLYLRNDPKNAIADLETRLSKK